MDCILRGDLSITDNFEFIRDIITSPPNDNIKVISLEEVPTIDLNLPNVIGGSFLLPPIDAMMAAANSDEEMFTQLYVEHLNNPAVTEFIALIITVLYRGTNLILFYPDDDLNLKGNILDILWKMYGIAVGEIGLRQCQYDVSCTPIWLNLIYMTGALNPMELLYLYPEKALLEDRLIYNLITAIRPIGDTYQEKAQFILDLRHKLKENKNVIVPFIAVENSVERGY